MKLRLELFCIMVCKSRFLARCLTRLLFNEQCRIKPRPVTCVRNVGICEDDAGCACILILNTTRYKHATNQTNMQQTKQTQ